MGLAPRTLVKWIVYHAYWAMVSCCKCVRIQAGATELYWYILQLASFSTSSSNWAIAPLSLTLKLFLLM